jgi:hypothetical protein
VPVVDAIREARTLPALAAEQRPIAADAHRRGQVRCVLARGRRHASLVSEAEKSARHAPLEAERERGGAFRLLGEDATALGASAHAPAACEGHERTRTDECHRSIGGAVEALEPTRQSRALGHTRLEAKERGAASRAAAVPLLPHVHAKARGEPRVGAQRESRRMVRERAAECLLCPDLESHTLVERPSRACRDHACHMRLADLARTGEPVPQGSAPRSL